MGMCLKYVCKFVNDVDDENCIEIVSLYCSAIVVNIWWFMSPHQTDIAICVIMLSGYTHIVRMQGIDVQIIKLYGLTISHIGNSLF